MKILKAFSLLIIALLLAVSCTNPPKQLTEIIGVGSGVTSINTDYTLMKVRVASSQNTRYIVASSYEGTLLGISFKGEILWENPLKGFMNHDVWCADMNGDGNDEVMAANADGTLYCLNSQGILQWGFKPSLAPMYSVCTVKDGDQSYIVCGGYDKNMYYLNKEGHLLKTVSSYTYSQENPWQPYPKEIPDSGCHLANYIRPVKKADGTEVLAVQGVIHTMAVQARGSVYFFEPLADKPYDRVKLEQGRPMGELRCADTDGDGNEELLMGSSTMIHDAILLHLNPANNKQCITKIKDIPGNIDAFGYRVVQPEILETKEGRMYAILFGARILLVPTNGDIQKSEVLACDYSFNDVWKDGEKLILASAQSGGSCVHIIDTKNPGWKQAYSQLQPPGKISKILANIASIRKDLKSYQTPDTKRHPVPVYLMTENVPKSISHIRDSIMDNCISPVFLNSSGTNRAEKYDRSSIKDDRYRNRRDKRRHYEASSEEIVRHFTSRYTSNSPGLSFWGGHGNDPYMFQRKTLEKILDHANGKKTVLIFPELEDHSDHFSYVMDDYFYPLADYCRKTNGQIFVRTKHAFWFSNIYLPMWSKLTSGEYADIFIPSMEETTDKSMELSLAARVGVWASGATDSWGSRCARDNPSFDRLRQHSHQMLPNHFLRMLVYHLSNGVQYLDNFPVNQEYISLYWELIAKGALFVPKRSEILSISPVHLSMITPDKHFMDASSNVKWTTFFDKDFEENNTFVFSRLSGSWPGAPVTEWDFSNYAAGVKERRQNFLAPYKNGLVLLTPPQKGKFADVDAPRGLLTDHLHPIYKNIMREYYTDGRYYYSADGENKYDPESYYKIIENAIQEHSKHLPVTVSGDVAWVVAQTSPTNLRLTIIDAGYLNPNDRTATVTFNTILPISVTDILDKTKFEIKGGQTQIEIPCGAFRFIDVALEEPL